MSNMRKYLQKAKLVVNVRSNKKTKKIETVSIFDNRTGEYWTDERIESRGVRDFLNVDDMKQTLDWNLNGDDSKYRLYWGQSGKEYSDGTAYVFD